MFWWTAAGGAAISQAVSRPHTPTRAWRSLIGKVPSFCYENGWLNCDFQHAYMRRAAEQGDTTISPKQEAALAAFVAVSNHPEVVLKMMLKPGDFQFINNRTILHGRAEFEDHGPKDQRCHLYRLWVNVPEWPH